MFVRSEKEIRADLRVTRKEMKDSGVRRISCFNGGHSALSYRLNSAMFALQCELDKAKEQKQVS